MLNWEQISERINNPSICTSDDITDLKELCIKYPYSQVFSMLYLKVLADYNHISFEEELEKHAFKITNRIHLYDLIHSTSKVENVDTKIELEPNFEFENQGISIEIPNEKINNIDSTQIDSDNENNLINGKPSQSEAPNEDLVLDKINSINDDTVESFLSESESEKETKSPDDLEISILASSLTASYSLEEIEEPSLPEFDLSVVNNEEEFDSNELGTEIVSKSALNINEPKSFTDWLKLSWSEQNAEQEIDQEIKDESTEVTYIEFEKPKREFFSPIKKAKESLSEETLPVSETLAKVFEMQGNISKAIYVYEQLSLIIPEKKIYFASQIKKLTKKQN